MVASGKIKAARSHSIFFANKTLQSPKKQDLQGLRWERTQPFLVQMIGSLLTLERCQRWMWFRSIGDDSRSCMPGEALATLPEEVLATLPGESLATDLKPEEVLDTDFMPKEVLGTDPAN